MRGPRLVLCSARAGLTTQREQALIEQPGEREQPGREPDPRPGVAEVGNPGDAADLAGFDAGNCLGSARASAQSERLT